MLSEIPAMEPSLFRANDREAPLASVNDVISPAASYAAVTRSPEAETPSSRRPPFGSKYELASASVSVKPAAVFDRLAPDDDVYEPSDCGAKLVASAAAASRIVPSSPVQEQARPIGEHVSAAVASSVNSPDRSEGPRSVTDPSAFRDRPRSAMVAQP